MDLFLTATNCLLLLFWVRLWSRPDRELYFNPFLSAPTRLTDRSIDFLRPALPLPDGLLALLLLLFLLAFRAAVLIAAHAELPWQITLGTVFLFVPRTPDVNSGMIFSLLHFLFFIVRYWGVYVLIQCLTPVRRRDRTSEAFRFAARPLSMLRTWAQILLLLATNGVLVAALTYFGAPYSHPLIAGTEHLVVPALPATDIHLPELALLTLCSIADLLVTAWQLMFSLLIGAFAAAMLQNALLGTVCNEAVATMIGSTRKRLIVGIIDFTPLLYMLSAHLLYTAVVMPILRAALQSLR